MMGAHLDRNSLRAGDVLLRAFGKPPGIARSSSRSPANDAVLRTVSLCAAGGCVPVGGEFWDWGAAEKLVGPSMRSTGSQQAFGPTSLRISLPSPVRLR